MRIAMLLVKVPRKSCFVTVYYYIMNQNDVKNLSILEYDVYF